MAIAGMGALQRHGYNVPRDISGVGHDDLPFGQWIHPRLTTISQDLHQIGRVSALRLLQLLGTEHSQLPMLDAPQLIVRESTAPPLERVGDRGRSAGSQRSLHLGKKAQDVAPRGGATAEAETG